MQTPHDRGAGASLCSNVNVPGRSLKVPQIVDPLHPPPDGEFSLFVIHDPLPWTANKWSSTV